MEKQTEILRNLYDKFKARPVYLGVNLENWVMRYDPPITNEKLLELEVIAAKYNGGFELIIDDTNVDFKYFYKITEQIDSGWHGVREDALAQLLVNLYNYLAEQDRLLVVGILEEGH